MVIVSLTSFTFRKSEKRKKKNKRLNDLNVDWRLDDRELNKEFESDIYQGKPVPTSIILICL